MLACSQSHEKCPDSFIMSVYLSAYIKSAPTGWIFVKFDIGDLRNTAKKIKILLKSDKNIRHFKLRPKYIYIVDSSTVNVVVQQ